MTLRLGQGEAFGGASTRTPEKSKPFLRRAIKVALSRMYRENARTPEALGPLASNLCNERCDTRDCCWGQSVNPSQETPLSSEWPGPSHDLRISPAFDVPFSASVPSPCLPLPLFIARSNLLLAEMVLCTMDNPT